MSEEKNSSSVGHVPEGKWAFDSSVTAVFDDMLSRSIPQYEVMRTACFDLGKRYVKPKTAIVDLGCSRGEALASFVDCFGAHNTFTGVEVSKPMLEATRTRYKGYVECGVMHVREQDLRTSYPPVAASLTLAVLTLQFTPIEYRQGILRNAWKNTIDGGALIVVEKVLGSTAELDAAMVDVYLDMKKKNGYSQDEIDRKKLSLEGVLVPVTADWNVQMLRAAGFQQVDCFWRWLNFAGWIAVKGQ